jgi:hypothetical protein
MRRHVIIGRLGILDKARIPAAIDEVVTDLLLVSAEKRLDFGIGHALDDLKKLSLLPSNIGLDLLVLASLVYAADTRICRATESQDAWTREIRLVVPVSDPARWTTQVLMLRRILNFLTGDRWTVDFRPYPKGVTSSIPTRPTRTAQPSFDMVALFSGGLDSLVGAIDVLEGSGVPLFISHAGEGATSDAQNNCFEALKAYHKKRPFDRLRVWMSFPKTLVRGVDPEGSTRARSFLFFALGVFAGTGLGRPFALRVPENGFIALNVPLDRLRLGSLSTRTTHPFYMARWNELLTALSIPCRLENPYWQKTKGEMITACANPKLLHELVPKSLSCSSPTKGRWQGHGIEHCGYCLPCLIRRAALQMALGKASDPTIYTAADFGTRILDTRQSEGQQVRSFQVAIARLRTRPALAKLFIYKSGPLFDEATHLDDLVGVYRRGLDEVEALLAGVRVGPS